jgi:hypothetical protein
MHCNKLICLMKKKLREKTDTIATATLCQLFKLSAGFNLINALDAFFLLYIPFAHYRILLTVCV